MKLIKLFVRILPIILIFISFAACGMNNGGETETDLYANIDLSQYSEYGFLSDDGIMWVKKSGYDGVEYGYINSNGEYVVPLSSEITLSHDFQNGFAVAEFGDQWQGILCKIYNTSGEVVGQFFREAITSISHLNNGNIYLEGVSVSEDSSVAGNNAYMFCAESKKMVEMPVPTYPMNSPDYSDGLMLVYSNFMVETIKYFDSDGNCVIDLVEDNDYSVVYATDFIDGKASITFVGKDSEHYIVDIDKTGKWLTEPVVTYDGRTFWNKYGE